jgi:PIN domain nuclease of toxin-antitoxin system
MTVILDTHILLWALSDSEKLARAHLEVIEDPTNSVLVSSVSIAEIAIKSSIGKLELEESLYRNNLSGFLELIRDSGFEFVDYGAEDAALLNALPWHHRDPFDRMLIGQAINRGYQIATADSAFRLYSVHTVG